MASTFFDFGQVGNTDEFFHSINFFQWCGGEGMRVVFTENQTLGYEEGVEVIRKEHSNTRYEFWYEYH